MSRLTYLTNILFGFLAANAAAPSYANEAIEAEKSMRESYSHYFERLMEVPGPVTEQVARQLRAEIVTPAQDRYMGAVQQEFESQLKSLGVNIIREQLTPTDFAKIKQELDGYKNYDPKQDSDTTKFAGDLGLKNPSSLKAAGKKPVPLEGGQVTLTRSPASAKPEAVPFQAIDGSNVPREIIFKKK